MVVFGGKKFLGIWQVCHFFFNKNLLYEQHWILLLSLSGKILPKIKNADVYSMQLLVVDF